METTVEFADGGAWIAISGRLDTQTASSLDRELLALVGQGHRHLAFDLAGLEFVSSAGLRSFLYVAKRLKSERGSVRFCGLQRMVLEVFSISGFDTMFPVFPSRQEVVRPLDGN
jgi:anti-anti-sigma factor